MKSNSLSFFMKLRNQNLNALEPQFSYNGYTLLVSWWGFLKLRRSD